MNNERVLGGCDNWELCDRDIFDSRLEMGNVFVIYELLKFISFYSKS